MPPTNQAAWQVSKGAKPLEVKPAPYTPPGAGELVVKNAAVAINPVDWAIQSLGHVLLSHIRYPFVLGADVAGEVVEVGSGVRRFRPGDCVIGLAFAADPHANRPAEGAFQLYTVVREHLAATIPDDLSYERACLLPLGLSTAAYGLFHADFLALNTSSVPPPPPRFPAGDRKAAIITAGASSVGSCAIQLAVSAGYEVYSTASPKNTAYVTGLGATGVFDYHSPSWVHEMAAALWGKEVAGAYAIGNRSVEGCIEVRRWCAATGSPTNKFVAYTGAPWPDKIPTNNLAQEGVLGSTLWWMGSTAVKSVVGGVRTKVINAKDLFWPNNVVSGVVFEGFLTRAVSAGQVMPAPEPLIVGTGLEKIQEAMGVQLKGVSARKVVVTH